MSSLNDFVDTNKQSNMKNGFVEISRKIVNNNISSNELMMHIVKMLLFFCFEFVNGKINYFYEYDGKLSTEELMYPPKRNVKAICANTTAFMMIDFLEKYLRVGVQCNKKYSQKFEMTSVVWNFECVSFEIQYDKKEKIVLSFNHTTSLVEIKYYHTSLKPDVSVFYADFMICFNVDIDKVYNSFEKRSCILEKNQRKNMSIRDIFYKRLMTKDEWNKTQNKSF